MNTLPIPVTKPGKKETPYVAVLVNNALFISTGTQKKVLEGPHQIAD